LAPCKDPTTSPAGKAKPKKLTTRTFRTARGPRVTVEWGRGLDDELVRAALAEAMKAAAEGRDAA
jgi:hypothetical protein